MNRPRLCTALAVASATVVAAQVSVAAYNLNFSCSPSPTTHSAWSTLTCSFTTDPARTWTSAEIALAAGESIAHHGDTGTPADGTEVGTASMTAYWVSNLCSSRSTQSWGIYWIAPDGGYSPTDGTVVAELQLKSNSLLFTATFDAYVVEDSSGGYRIEIPNVPNLECHSSSYPGDQVFITLGKVGTTTYDIHRNPPTVGTNSISISIRYSDGTVDTGSTTFSTT